jgi:hypothetical protein
MKMERPRRTCSPLLAEFHHFYTRFVRFANRSSQRALAGSSPTFEEGIGLLVTGTRSRGVTQNGRLPNRCEDRRRETSEGEGTLEREEATTADERHSGVQAGTQPFTGNRAG